MHDSHPGAIAPTRRAAIEKRPLPVPVEEYQARLEAVQAQMTRDGVDVFLVTDPSNLCYLCGYEASSAYVAQALVIFPDETQPLFYLRRMDAPAAMYLSYIDNDRIIGYPERYIGDAEVNGFDYIFKAIEEARQVHTVALEYGAVSGAALDGIRTRYDHLSFADLGTLIEGQRLTKSPRERELMRKAGRITQHVALQLADWFAPGRRECDVAADITAALVKGLPDQPGEYTEEVLMPGGRQVGTSHITWTPKTIQQGTHYNIEFAAGHCRYQAPIMRTVSVGSPSEKLIKLYSAMMSGCEAALAAIKPGGTCADVAKAYCAIMDRDGYYKDSRCGYPIGINWLEGSCSLRVDDKTELREGMAFHLMLGTWLDNDFGAVLSEAFLVTASGYELLYDVPRDLIVV